MKNTTRIAAFMMALMFVVMGFAACTKEEPKDPVGTTTEAGQTTAAPEITTAPSTEEPEADPVEIVIAEAKGTAALTGDVKAVFAKETAGENIVAGPAQTPINHAVYGAFSTPTVVTKLILTAPGENQNDMASATIDGSVDGKTWVPLKKVGSTVTAGKTYTLNVADETAYLYIRIRQSDEARTQAFRVRNLRVEGLPQSGNAGSIASIEMEKELDRPIVLASFLTPPTLEGKIEFAFTDDGKNWAASGAAVGSPNFVIGVMDKKTELRKVTVKFLNSNITGRGTKLLASTDGKTWKELYTFEDQRTTGEDGTKVIPETAEYTYYFNDTETYSFIKLVQRDDLAPYTWRLDDVLISGIATDEKANELPRKYVDAKTVAVTYDKSNTVNHNSITPDVIWDLNKEDKDTVYIHRGQDSLTEYKKFFISGKLAAPTVITKIVYSFPADKRQFTARSRNAFIEASVDGVTWEKIATFPGSLDAFPVAGGSFSLMVDSDTAYNYVRICQNPDWYKSYWTIGTVEIQGVAEEAKA